MSHRIVRAVVCVCLAAASTGIAHAQQSRPGARTNRSDATARIVGRIFDASTNAPIRRAQIQGSNSLEFVDALSDDDGRFALDLRPGQWRITVAKGGYFTWQLGQRRPFDSSPPLTLTRGQRVTADVPLSRGGVITGRVFDESGEPLAALRVRVYRARMAQGHRRLEDVGAGDYTDDTGAYRVFGLPPGDYYVAASLRMAPLDSVVQTTYSSTYYPGTGELAEAQRIRVELGTESTAIFPLLPVRSVSISGTVLTSSGGPANAFLNVASESSELGTSGVGGVTQPDGTFIIPDVPPGRYTLTASLRGDGPSESGATPLTIGTDDMSGITLVTGRPATMKGRFVADTGVVGKIPDGLVVATAARAGGTVLSSGSGSAFELDDLSEPFTLHVENLPDGWTVKAIVVNGADVTDAKMTLAPNQEAEGLIVVTNRLTALTGIVSASAGQPAKGEVVVFAADAAKWTYPSRFVRTVSADDKGRFRITGLPPADRYLVLAADYLEDGEQYDPEFLERMRDAATEFSLGNAETRTLDLKVMER